MPRPVRLNLPDIPQHITQRGNNRQACFYSNEDYRLYLDLLHEACRNHDCSLHAYVLMTNHVHLLMTPSTPEGVSMVIRDLGRDYVRTINKTYRRSGTLWEGRFKSSLVDKARYCLTCYRYIELNPVRAGMANHPADYPWSSFR
jgi:putative transposase